MDGLRDIFEENNFPVVVSGYPAMFSFALDVDRVTCQRDWSESNRELYLSWQRWQWSAVSCRIMTPESHGSCVTNTRMPILTKP